MPSSERSVPKRFVPEPYPYHHELELDITALTNLGVGIGREEGWVVMVPFALPGEKVRARIFRNHKNYSEADLIEVLEPSPDRVEPQCPLFGACGGCQYQNYRYEAQLEMKRAHVQDLFKRLGQVEIEVLPTVASPRIYGYRFKITPHFKKKPKPGEPLPIGFQRMDSRRLIDVPQCPIATEAINEALPEQREEVLSGRRKFKRGGTLLLRDSLEGVTTDNNEIISQRVGDLLLQFQAGEFFQNNPFILPLMVDHVVGEACGPGLKNLVDAYCGVGVFCLAASKSFESCAGVEVSAISVRWANANALLNKIENCSFIVGKAEAIFEGLEFIGEETSVVIDPPRRGCDKLFLDQLFAFAPSRVVYVSCDPATQARDVQKFAAAGYRVEKVQPFDLFPHTRHIESVATLVKDR